MPAALVLAACAAIGASLAAALGARPAASAPPARGAVQTASATLAGAFARSASSPLPRADLLAGGRVTTQDGWLLVHLEGTPYQIGYQRGYLTGKLAVQWLRSYLGPAGANRTSKRRIAARCIWPKVPSEYRQELRGIVAGMKTRGDKVDLWDVVAANAWADVDVYESSGTSAAGGGHTRVGGGGRAAAPAAGGAEPAARTASARTTAARTTAARCSAFIATGAATADHRIVMGHTTWSAYEDDFTDHVIFDVKPARGHEFRYQAAAGNIWSGEDWYVNDAGLMICETSFEDSPVNPKGIPLFVRIREAVQYGSSIDDVVRTLRRHNNGAYPCEWLIGDARTSEIASLQLGCRASDLKRTSSGFYGSSNWPTGRNWLRETPWDSPSWSIGEYDRYERWLDLRDQYWGRIDAQIGETMLSDHHDYYLDRTEPSSRTICGHFEDETVDSRIPYGSLDGKVITSAMALNGMQMLARWGHPCGEHFDAASFLRTHPGWAKSADSFAIAGLRTFSKETPQPWTLVGGF